MSDSWHPMWEGLFKPVNDNMYVDVEIEGEGIFTGRISVHGNDIVFPVITHGRLLRWRNIRSNNS